MNKLRDIFWRVSEFEIDGIDVLGIILIIVLSVGFTTMVWLACKN